MNLNGQIDWNDTRYVSLNGSWWRESSSWQARQNGSPARHWAKSGETRLLRDVAARTVRKFETVVEDR